MTAPVMAHGPWKTNGEMIADAARLGYVSGRVIDLTYGLGKWWTHCTPDLVAVDLDRDKVPELGYCKDFRDTGFETGSFDTVCFDPPYKLNGTPSGPDAAYGVDQPGTIAERHRLMVAGLQEAKRLCAIGGHVLVKCQDQVASGRKWWQTDLMTFYATTGHYACRKVDVMQIESYRAQPAGRRQVHARVNFSTLLIFRREYR